MSSADFQAAQQRIAARQAAHAASVASQLHAPASSPLHKHLSHLPPSLNRLGAAGITAWDTIRGRSGTSPAFRVGQADAELLDEELLSLLRGQITSGLKYFGDIQEEWGEEVGLALRGVLFKVSVWDHALYGLLTVFGPYAWIRWERYLSSPSFSLSSRLNTITSRLTTVYSLASLASFSAFLLNGHYRTLLDRALRLRLAPRTNQLARDISFEYLNRQLVWHAFTEFLLFLLPLLGIARWRRWLSRTWRRVSSLSSPSDGPAEVKQGPLAHLPERTCAICYEDQNKAKSEAEIVAASAAGQGGVAGGMTDVTNPYCGACGCVYCFVCLAGRLEGEAGEGWVCLRCGEVVQECWAWGGDVIEEKPVKVGREKKVGFVDGNGSSSESESVSEERDEEGSEVYEENEMPDFDE
ncbi:hypothetical protein GMDG_00725 [Pseudogymnoascus destructans 20631-21]|uniref:Pex N-terminal domain-containing protein n=1 Tax=Pseudogymnoascus destructans (strain ATCC MYA-4855 / 20631-21) TaxID=658429 RepID=L8GA61_PSED2|nr:hypothetical protein GMDG_00725 [Pseudogymnoascus destructans 20631-21]